MTTLPVADARARLSELISDAQSTHERYEITRNGRPAAVLLAADDYDSMKETIEVLADAELMRAHRDGLAELRSDEYLDADQLTDVMRRAGRT